jgi:hypothetical protein
MDLMPNTGINVETNLEYMYIILFYRNIHEQQANRTFPHPIM